MGLENGIRIKDFAQNSLIEKFFRSPFGYRVDNEIEICYWRRCRNIRSMILNILHEPINTCNYEFVLTRKDIIRIKKGLKLFLNKSCAWRDSAWEFYEIEESLKRDVRNLRILSFLMKFKNFNVYFYDSY